MADDSYFSIATTSDSVPSLTGLANVGAISIHVDGIDGWDDDLPHGHDEEHDQISPLTAMPNENNTIHTLARPNQIRQDSEESDFSAVSGLSGLSGSTDGKHQKRPSMFQKPNWQRTDVRRTVFITHQIRVFDEEWEELDFLGEPGQFGQAMKCFRKDDPQRNPYCVKRINKAKFTHIDPMARKSVLTTMQNEIWTLQVVDHQNIVKLHDVYEDRNWVHLVLDFCAGGELFERICEVESFTEYEAARIVRQILLALEHMHDKNIAHLDLKPENILFAEPGADSDIKIIDFGMAQVIPRLQVLSALTGTPYYMAPEVLKGEYNRAADVWSVGIILYCLIFGYPPFYVDDEDEETFQLGQTLEEKIYANIERGFTAEVLPDYGPWFPEENIDEVSPEVIDLISSMLKSEPADRVTVKQALDSKWIRMEFKDSQIPRSVRDGLLTFQKRDKFRVAVSRLFSSNMTHQDIETVKALFDKWDVNGDGVLTLDEFKEGLRSQDEFGDMTDRKIEQIFANVDIDGSKNITIDELLTMTAHQTLIAADERLMRMFVDLDEDGDGTLTADELKKALNDADIRDFDAHELIELADVNGDGVVDYEEFLRVLMPQFTNLAMECIPRPQGIHHQLPWEYVDDVGNRLQSESYSAISKASSRHASRSAGPGDRSRPPELVYGGDNFRSVSSGSERSMDQELQQKLEQKLEQSEKDRHYLQEQITYLNKQLEQRGRDLDDMKQAYEGQQDTVRKFQTEMHTLQETLRSVEHEKSATQSSVEHLNEKIKTLEEKNEKLKAEVKSAKQDFQDAVHSKMTLLMKTNEEIEYLRGLVHDLGGDSRLKLRRPRSTNGYR